MLSMAMSPQAKCLECLKPFSMGTVISPEQKKLKKQRVTVAHITIMPLFVRWGDQCSFRLCRIVGRKLLEA